MIVTMRRFLSLFLLVALIALMVVAVVKERHTVYSLQDGTAKTLNGLEFTKTSAVDGVMLDKSNGKGYDVYSLMPEFLQEKDCPT